jgi:predicted dehydrogenase
VPVEQEEPLKRELADFVDAIITGRAPQVTGEDGRRALALAQQIADRMADQMQPGKRQD